jgi:hypothetical protein
MGHVRRNLCRVGDIGPGRAWRAGARRCGEARRRVRAGGGDDGQGGEGGDAAQRDLTALQDGRAGDDGLASGHCAR